MAPDVIGIDLLEKWVNALDGEGNTESLRGVSFEKTKNESLGLAGKIVDGKEDFTVFIPWGEWKNANNRTYPSQLQKAFFDVLDKSKKMEAASPFLDMATLLPHVEFFTESETTEQKRSVAKAIANWVDHYDTTTTTPVIRLTIGDENSKNWHDSLAHEPITNIFWPVDKEKGVRVPLVKHPRARIYVGYYNPNLHPK